MSSPRTPGATAGSARIGRRALLGGALLTGTVLAAASVGQTTPTVADSGSSRLALAHYFGPYPRSLDNGATRDSDYYTTQLLDPSGEGGRHAAYGGLLRDRPIFRPRDASSSWPDHDCEFDIRAARAAGLDGFFVDIMSAGGANWDRYLTLRDTADRLDVDFVIVPMLDTTGGAAAAGTAAAAEAIAQFTRSRSAWRLADGRVVFSSFKTEGKSLAWWQDVISRLEHDHGVATAFISVALDGGTHPTYQSITYAESVWSYGADPASISHAADQAVWARQRGKRFMAPVNGQDCRPYASTFNEASNTEATRAAWDKLTAQAADFVQVVTWSDFSEGSAVAPSEARGYAPLRLTSRYLRRWKSGQSLAADKEELLISHRSSFVGARPTGPQTRFMDQGASRYRTRPRDTVEALTFLDAPADVTLRIGDRTVTYRAPAGMYAQLEPLAVGTVSGAVSRGSRQFASVVSPVPVVANPVRDDLQYFWVSSAGTTGQRAPWTV